jgi:hypothetical protein
MDFSSLDRGIEAPFTLDWEQAHFSFDVGTSGCALMLGIRVADSIQLNFNGLANHGMRMEVKKAMESSLGKLLKTPDASNFSSKEQLTDNPSIDAA